MVKCIGFRNDPEKNIPIPITIIYAKEFYEVDISSAIRGDSRQFTPNDQCWCNTTNGCYPEQLCGDCNLDLSGQCSQSAGESSVPGV